MNLCECGHIYTYHNEHGCGGTVEFKGVAVRNFKPCGCTHYRPTPPQPPTAPPAESVEDAKAFKRVAIELRIRFPVEIQYNSEFEAMVKRLEMGRL